MAINLKDGVFKVANAVHPALLRLSGGRIGRSISGMPVVVLTTTGRKTGKPRSVPLMALEHEGHTYIIASKGGDDHHPTWYLNLVATPEVSVQLHGRTERRVARTLSAEEKAEVWPLITSAFSGYASYQKKTDREIPVVELVPTPG